MMGHVDRVRREGRPLSVYLEGGGRLCEEKIRRDGGVQILMSFYVVTLTAGQEYDIIIINDVTL